MLFQFIVDLNLSKNLSIVHEVSSWKNNCRMSNVEERLQDIFIGDRTLLKKYLVIGDEL